MYDPKTQEKLNTFRSVAEGARHLFEKEFGKFNKDTATDEEKERYIKKCRCFETLIRDTSKKERTIKKGEFIWKFDNDETEEFRKKFSKHI